MSRSNPRPYRSSIWRRQVNAHNFYMSPRVSVLSLPGNILCCQMIQMDQLTKDYQALVDCLYSLIVGRMQSRCRTVPFLTVGGLLSQSLGSQQNIHSEFCSSAGSTCIVTEWKGKLSKTFCVTSFKILLESSEDSVKKNNALLHTAYKHKNVLVPNTSQNFCRFFVLIQWGIGKLGRTLHTFFFLLFVSRW